MSKILKKYQYSIFAVAMTVVTLWQLLLPGYVLLLDWVPGPIGVFNPQSAFQFMNAPVDGLVYLLGQYIPAWMVQKGMLIGLVFAMFYLPLRYYPFDKKFGAAFFASLLFVLNPWVYMHMLTGQWKVLAGYMLIWPLIYALIKYMKSQTWRKTFNIFFILFLLQIFSVHFFMIGIILFAVSLMILFAQKVLVLQNPVGFIWKAFVMSFIFIFISLYWVIPFAMSDTATGGTLQSFDAAHIEAFATEGASQLGKVGNVLMMHGMWIEGEPWAERFIMPKDALLWYPAFALLIFLVLRGVYHLAILKKEYALTLFLLALFAISVFFAIGNDWMFAHVSIWSGFRDSQKWAGVLALVYTLFASIGIGCVMASVAAGTLKRTVLSTVFSLPFFLMPMMLFGFAGQLNTTWYPQEWQKVNESLQTYKVETGNCKVIFLPWQQYYFANFNNGQLIANPARKYFDCDVLSGQNIELNGIHLADGLEPWQYRLNAAMIDNNANPKAVISFLKKRGVTHIIKTESKPYYYHAYHFIPYALTTGQAVKKVTTKNIDLYVLHDSI